MKTSGYFGLTFTALAITLQVSSAMADPGGGFWCPGPERCWCREAGHPIKCPENGFGSRTPVTLPPDRHPPAGKSTGIPVTKTPSSVLINAQPTYFRPR